MIRFWREQWYRFVRTGDMPATRKLWLESESNRLVRVIFELNRLMNIYHREHATREILSILAECHRTATYEWHTVIRHLDNDYGVTEVWE